MVSTQQPGLHVGEVPLAVRMRPTSLDEIAGQRHVLKPGAPLVTLAHADTAHDGAISVILWGPPGTGKTTLAQVIARTSKRRFVELLLFPLVCARSSLVQYRISHKRSNYSKAPPLRVPKYDNPGFTP